MAVNLVLNKKKIFSLIASSCITGSEINHFYAGAKWRLKIYFLVAR